VNELNIDLSGHPDKFTTDTLSIEKKINYLYGKNGTGKSTIANEVERQFSEAYDVHVFRDFDGVAENSRLDAIALGTENAEIQAEIDLIDGQITEVRKEVEELGDGTTSLLSRYKDAEKSYTSLTSEIDKFLADSARNIKRRSDPQVADTGYNKNSFLADISSASIRTEVQIQELESTLRADRKQSVNDLRLPIIAFAELLKDVNEILGLTVIPQVPIPELENNAEKQQFAREGVRIHGKGDSCAFCGGEVSPARWASLASYFNETVRNIEGRIDQCIREINNRVEQVRNIAEVDRALFYDKFSSEIVSLNTRIKLTKNEQLTFLKELSSSLVKKKGLLFISENELDIKLPSDFAEVIAIYGAIANDHNELSLNLEQVQAAAKDNLRKHLVAECVKQFDYDEKQGALKILKTAFEQSSEELEGRKGEIAVLEEKRRSLFAETKDEKRVAERINVLLRSNGISSFSLELVIDDSEHQKGQYRVKGHNGLLRSVTKLSKGEKNIIAFLYFMLRLEDLNNRRPRVIILDDPMTSNDDTMQYLMIDQVRRFTKEVDQRNDRFLLFTHNFHFFINVRNNKAGAYASYSKHGNFLLRSDGNISSIVPITSSKMDVSSSYEELWRDLREMYRLDQPRMMLGTCRRICDTYSKFNRITDIFGDNTATKKLFDVNLHSIDDLEADMFGKTSEELKSMLENVFIALDDKEHFDAHWSER
jgi:wobble nucleotide-excising tRNase